MSGQVIDRDVETEGLPIPAPDSELLNSHNWPEVVYVIRFPDGKYACNRVITHPPDSMILEGLAVHPSMDSITAYVMGTGDQLPPDAWVDSVPYSEARQIAVGKDLDALFLFIGLKIVDVEYLK